MWHLFPFSCYVISIRSAVSWMGIVGGIFSLHATRFLLVWPCFGFQIWCPQDVTVRHSKLHYKLSECVALCYIYGWVHKYLTICWGRVFFSNWLRIYITFFVPFLPWETKMENGHWRMLFWCKRLSLNKENYMNQT